MQAENHSDTRSLRHAAPPPRRSWWKISLLILVLCSLAVAATFYRPLLNRLTGVDSERHALTYEVVRTPLQITVSAEGNVESASNVEVKCRVAGGSTILWIVEDGKIVEGGEEIVRLDTAPIDDQLNSQRIVFENALAAKIQAQEAFEVAKISVHEYQEGTFVQELNQIEADIQIAMENLRSAENQLTFSKRMARKGFVSSLQRDADEFAVKRAQLDLKAANTRKKVLVDFTQKKMLTDLEAQREAAEATLRAVETSLKLERDRLERLQAQLKNCVVDAPKKGMVVYANNTRRSRYRSSDGPQIEEGATVREGQALVRLPDLTQMQTRVMIHESRVDQVRVGMPARIVVQDEEYSGKVLEIANQPQPTSWFSANVKEYATMVSIEGESNNLRPGMTAEVTILIDDADDLLTIPVSSVVEQRGEFFCWTQTSGTPEKRPLVLGRTNDKLIEVIDGLKAGDVVYRNPRAVIEAARTHIPFESEAEDVEFANSEVPEVSRAKGRAASQRASDADGKSTERRGHQPEPGAKRDARRDSGDGGSTQGRRSGGGFNLSSLDRNGDGKLTREEFPSRMQTAFSRFDTNGDGFVDAGEFAAMLEQRRQRRGVERGTADGQRGSD